MAHPTPKILVVDDYEPNRTVYAHALAEIQGVEVVQAANGKEALERAREGGFAMYLLDIHMPDMDGFELGSMLRQELDGEPIPIVYITSDDFRGRGELLRSYRMGAIDFLALGPLRTEILVQKARFFVKMFRRRQELARDVEEVRSENERLQAALAEYKRREQILRTQATHDVLTKLPNRALFQDRLEVAIARSHRNRCRVALAYLDLDGFKDVNDRHGHGTGDALLVSFANRLLKSVRETDTVARLGGDEFAVLLEGLESSGGAVYAANKVFGAITQPLTLRSESEQRDITLRPGVSMGLAVYPEHAHDAQGLVVYADQAMYDAKRAGGGVRFHDPDAQPRIEPRAEPKIERAASPEVKPAFKPLQRVR